MRRVCLLLLLASAPVAVAQTPDSTQHIEAPIDTGIRVLAPFHSAENSGWFDVADALVRSLGHPWTNRQLVLPDPDSTLFENNVGDVWWSVPGASVDGFRAVIQNGLVESVTLDFSPDGPDLAGFARRLYNRLGSPRPDGFYAIDQTGYPFSLAIDVQANRLTARAVPGQLVID